MFATMQAHEDRVSYRFGPFRLDPAGRRLTRGKETLCLTPKGFDVLVALVEARGEVVERDVLMDRVWPDTAVVDANLTQTVSVLRKVLGDTASDHEYVATVPGRGYQFTAPVETNATETTEHSGPAARGEPALDEAGDETGGPAGDGASGPSRRGHRARAAVALLALVTMLGIFALLAVRGRGSGAAEAAQVPSLAVLPLTVLTPETVDRALGVGLSDAITNRLSQRRSLAVRPTQTVLAATEREPEPLAAGRELGVGFVLGGTIRRGGDQVRASVQLIDVQRGKPLWAATFDQSADTLFALEDQISARIVSSLSVGENAPLAVAGYPTNGEGLAYQELILGRARSLERTREGFAAAVRHFERALEHDPGFAPALGHMAVARSVLATNGAWGGSSRPLLKSARAEAARAFELAPELPQAHEALGMVRMFDDYDWPGAIDALEEAVRLDSTGFRGHYLLSMALILAGDEERAWGEARQLRLDGRVTGSPVDVNHEYGAGLLALWLGRHQEARETLAQVVARRPDLGGVRMTLALSLDGLGLRDEALAELETAARTFPASDLGWATLVHYLGRSGDPAHRARAREILEELEQAPADAPSAELSLAVAHAGAGSKEKAIRHLWRAHEARAVMPILVLRDRRLDPLRDEPGFRRLLEAMNLPPGRNRPERLARVPHEVPPSSQR
jgi:DNA-binding winged helix-turn-helix (wHTH) protein/TolB-like protein